MVQVLQCLCVTFGTILAVSKYDHDNQRFGGQIPWKSTSPFGGTQYRCNITVSFHPSSTPNVGYAEIHHVNFTQELPKEEWLLSTVWSGGQVMYVEGNPVVPAKSNTSDWLPTYLGEPLNIVSEKNLNHDFVFGNTMKQQETSHTVHQRRYTVRYQNELFNYYSLPDGTIYRSSIEEQLCREDDRCSKKQGLMCVKSATARFFNCGTKYGAYLDSAPRIEPCEPTLGVLEVKSLLPATFYIPSIHAFADRVVFGDDSQLVNQIGCNQVFDVVTALEGFEQPLNILDPAVIEELRIITGMVTALNSTLVQQEESLRNVKDLDLLVNNISSVVATLSHKVLFIDSNLNNLRDEVSKFQAASNRIENWQYVIFAAEVLLLLVGFASTWLKTNGEGYHRSVPCYSEKPEDAGSNVNHSAIETGKNGPLASDVKTVASDNHHEDGNTAELSEQHQQSNDSGKAVSTEPQEQVENLGSEKRLNAEYDEDAKVMITSSASERPMTTGHHHDPKPTSAGHCEEANIPASETPKTGGHCEDAKPIIDKDHEQGQKPGNLKICGSKSSECTSGVKRSVVTVNSSKHATSATDTKGSDSNAGDFDISQSPKEPDVELGIV